jgi:YD repeat-containing protein
VANTFDPKGKTWHIDTVTVAPAVIDRNDCRVSSIRWVVASGGAAGNVVTITDPDGTTILWTSTNTNGATYEETDNAKRRFPIGFAVPTLAAGVLYVTME